jgi:hypothetical protein
VRPEEIKQWFTEAGWEIDGAFSGYLVIGYCEDNLSILAYEQAWEAVDPVFELVDHERNLIFRVQQIPTPKQAAKLLEEHGMAVEAEE